MSDPLRVGSLFSGIEGIGLGFERAGMRVVWQCEIDPHCQRVLRRRFPEATLYDDVTKLSGDNLARVDVLSGGFPCQDLSIAGRRAGLAGKRSGLFYEFMRLADELAPRWVVIENVPGLLSSRDGRDMGAVLGTLGELGYGFAYRVLDAQYFGVAQKRRRVFIVGCLGDAAGAAQVLFEPEGVRRNPPTRGEAGAGDAAVSVVSTIQGGGHRGYRIDAESAGGGNSSPSRKVVSALTSNKGGPDDNDAQAGHLVMDAPPRSLALTTRADRNDLETETFVVSGVIQGDLVGSLTHDGKAAGSATGQMVWSGHLIPVCVTGEVTHALTSEGHDASEDGSGRGEPIVSFVTENQRGEVRLTDTSFALAGPGGKPGQGYAAALVADGVRRLTPLERERLQGFPDDWTAGESDSARDRMTGNAVCVPVAEWIGRRLVATHRRFFEEE